MTSATKAIVMAGCNSCGEIKDSEVDFHWYAYTTSSGNRSIRRTSMCKICKNAARKAARQAPEVRERERQNRAKGYAANRAQQKEYRALRQSMPDHRRNKAKAQRIRKARMRASTSHNDAFIREIYQKAMEWQELRKSVRISDNPMDWQVHVDHIIPLCKGGRHVAENLQILSARDNLAKGGNIPPCYDNEVRV